METEGQNGIKRFSSPSDNLKSVQTQERDFTNFYLQALVSTGPYLYITMATVVAIATVITNGHLHHVAEARFMG